MITLRGPVTRRLNVIVILPLLMLLAACASQDETLKLGNNIALAGQAVADTGLDAYAEFIKQKDDEVFEKAEFAVLSVPGDNLPTMKPSDAASVVAPGISNFKALKRAYRQYQALTGGTFGPDAATASTGLVSSVNDFAPVLSSDTGGKPAISDQAAQTIKSLLLVAVTEAQANDVKRLNKGYAALVQAYQVWWKEEKDVLIPPIMAIHDSRINNVTSYSPSRFDPALLQSNAARPFDTKSNIKLYKIDEIRAALGRQNLALGKFAAVERRLEDLISAHAELSKQNPSLSATLSTLSKIEVAK